MCGLLDGADHHLKLVGARQAGRSFASDRRLSSRTSDLSAGGITIIHLLGRGQEKRDATPIEPLTPERAAHLRLPFVSRFTRATLSEHVRRYPGLAYVTEAERQYVVAGWWRRHTEIGELLEVTAGNRRPELVEKALAVLLDRGARLVVLDFGFDTSDRSLISDAGFDVIDRIVEYVRLNCDVGDVTTRAVQIRPYRPEDRAAVLDLERHSFPWLWWNSVDEWGTYLATTGVEVMLAEDAGEIVGYSSFTVRGRAGHLDRLAVRDSRQGAGFGAALLVDALQRMGRAGVQQVSLTTQEDNDRSQRLYERYGFRRGKWVYEIYGKWLAGPEVTR